MTLLDIRNQLFSHFCEKDTFSTEDFQSIVIPDKSLEEKRDVLIRAALAEMVELGVSRTAGDTLWILSHPVSGAGQTVQLSMRVSDAIAEVIETYLDGNDVEHDPIDKFNLHEGHIWHLLQIINEMSED